MKKGPKLKHLELGSELTHFYFNGKHFIWLFEYYCVIISTIEWHNKKRKSFKRNKYGNVFSITKNKKQEKHMMNNLTQQQFRITHHKRSILMLPSSLSIDDKS